MAVSWWLIVFGRSFSHWKATVFHSCTGG